MTTLHEGPRAGTPSRVPAPAGRTSNGAQDAPPTWRDLAASGALAGPVDPRHGGLGLTVSQVCERMELLGESNPDAGLSFSAVTSLASTSTPLQRFGSGQLRERYLPGLCDGSLVGAHAITEEASGSDALAMGTRAVRDGDEWVLDGAKSFVTNGSTADLVVVYARTSTERTPFSITAFLVPTSAPGFHVRRRVETMGLNSSPVAELALDGVRVPASHVLGRVGAGFLVLEHVMEREVLYAFSVNVGEMRRRLRRCVEHARSRVQYGRPIGSYQAVQHQLVDMRIGVESAHKWLRDAAALVDAGANATEAVSIAKVVTSTANVRSSLAAVQVFGGRGYLVEDGVEAGVRDAVAGTVYSGTNEIQYNRIAALMGLP
ncbi:acyl-CoA dehydrogenase family protein [Paenibacillus sp. TRM 82003]|uniref:acyl-CoA dehydrogenase family protein n=1 Tax=Kineococcus sp. TRM81007 TaxID=2925831 RepID=UPI001F57CCCC|nr:acyl-CoA dehydrogenase family protein [Kineococcus sp. TRM81007]MCI2237317.1 acyl-CoA dehydrogenase family protein [Kineococcus sp. TRM81007]MCI3926576.1 acyl-CoA dehydrogenase family protein [Paenibacillus sp. TRM 82003]